MTQNKSFAELAMDQTRIPSDASAVTTTLSKSLKDGEVLADDGNSYSSVQTAQDNASSWIKIPPNTFAEAVVINTAGLTVEGSGRDTLIDGDNSPAVTLDAQNITLKNLSHDAQNLNSGASVTLGSSGDSVFITSVVTRGSGNSGIEVDEGGDHTITKCRSESTSNNAFQILGPRSIISSTIVESASSGGCPIFNGDCVASSLIIFGGGGSGRGMDLLDDDCILSGCRIDGYGDGMTIRSGSTDNLIADCRISNTSGGNDFTDNGTSTLVATDDSANSTIITDDTSGQQSS